MKPGTSLRTRLLCLWIGAAACLATSPIISTGAYLGPAEGDRGEAPHHPPPPIIRPGPFNPVGAWLRTVRVSPPLSYGGLTVFPLVAYGAGGSDIRTLDEALASGWIEVREKESSSVEWVTIRNKSSHRVLLLGGESLVGGKQNRIVRNDLLLPPDSGFVSVPVYCGERERWAGGSDAFDRAGELTHPALRKQAVAGASQNAVWDEIETQSGRARVSSPTRDYQRIYADPRIGKELESCVAEYRGRWPSGSVGFVVSDGRSILGCDVFSDGDLFARSRDRLIRAYALEVVCRPDRRGWTRMTMSDVEDYLSNAAAAAAVEMPNPGEGTLCRLSGAVDGQALMWRNRVVHGVFFEAVVSSPPYRPPIGPPFHPELHDR